MKRHMSNNNAQGIVNKLPEDILCNILKCFPLKDAANLCLISKAWFSAWRVLSELRFDADFFATVLKGKKTTKADFFNILSVILLSHAGSIEKFHLCIPKRVTLSEPPYIGPWISYLSRKDVKDITINNDLQKTPLQLSYHLFSCLNLEKLTLDNCVLNLPPSSLVGMRKLKTLELERVTLVGNSFITFIARCPVLQSLTAQRCEGFESADISSYSLKYLTISGKFHTVKSPKNLIAFSVTLEAKIPNYSTDSVCDLIQSLAQSRRLEKLSFDGHFCQYLTAGKAGRTLPTSYGSLKSLQLSNIRTNIRDEFCWVVDMIKSCHVVEDLKISFSSVDDSAYPFIALDPVYQLAHLRQVELSSVRGVIMELKLIEFLLQCSPALNTMHILKDTKIRKVLESGLRQELIYYRRASPKATIIYD